MNFRVRVALLIYENESVLMIKHRKKEREYWLVPGGGIELDETIKETLKREMIEETGLEVEVGDFAFSCETIGNNRHILHLFFYGKRVGGNMKLGAEENLVDLKFVPLKELINIEIHPHVNEFIVKAYNKGFKPMHIHGNIWKD